MLLVQCNVYRGAQYVFCIKFFPGFTYSWDPLSPHSPPPQVTDHYCHILIQIQADLDSPLSISQLGQASCMEDIPKKIQIKVFI